MECKLLRVMEMLDVFPLKFRGKDLRQGTVIQEIALHVAGEVPPSEKAASCFA